MLTEMVEQGAGEKEGGVGFAEIEVDSPAIGDLAHRYSVSLMLDPEGMTEASIVDGIRSLTYPH